MINMKVAVVLLVVGALGTPSKALDKRLKTIDIETKITQLQKTVFMHTSRIIWKVIKMRGILLTLYLKNKTYTLEEINERLFNNNNNNNNNNIIIIIITAIINTIIITKIILKTHKTLHRSLIILKAFIMKW